MPKEAKGSLSIVRKVGESVVIADGLIVVTAARIGSNKVKLVFSAPRDIPINRGEVQRRIDAELQGVSSP